MTGVQRSPSGHRMLDDHTVGFRRQVIDALVTGDAAGYITQDRFTGKCPVCGDNVVFRFHGYAARVTVRCLDGCTEAEIGERLGLERR